VITKILKFKPLKGNEGNQKHTSVSTISSHISSSPEKQGVKLLGVLNYETGHIYYEENEKYDAEEFLSFLKNVQLIYSKGTIS